MQFRWGARRERRVQRRVGAPAGRGRAARRGLPLRARARAPPAPAPALSRGWGACRAVVSHCRCVGGCSSAGVLGAAIAAAGAAHPRHRGARERATCGGRLVVVQNDTKGDEQGMRPTQTSDDAAHTNAHNRARGARRTRLLGGTSERRPTGEPAPRAAGGHGTNEGRVQLLRQAPGSGRAMRGGQPGSIQGAGDTGNTRARSPVG